MDLLGAFIAPSKLLAHDFVFVDKDVIISKVEKWGEASESKGSRI